jgi:hypothetical protein
MGSVIGTEIRLGLLKRAMQCSAVQCSAVNCSEVLELTLKQALKPTYWAENIIRYTC